MLFFDRVNKDSALCLMLCLVLCLIKAISIDQLVVIVVIYASSKRRINCPINGCRYYRLALIQTQIDTLLKLLKILKQRFACK